MFTLDAFIIPQKNNEIFENYVASDCFLCYSKTDDDTEIVPSSIPFITLSQASRACFRLSEKLLIL